MASSRVSYPQIGSPESPDPLADSITSDYVSYPTTYRKSTPSESPTMQRTRKTSDITFSSTDLIPEQGQSPWRIKVTVEAEQDIDGELGPSHGKRQTITRTVKVPLKDAASPVKGSRATSSANKTKQDNKITSPARKARGRRKSITDLNAVVLGDDDEGDEWSAKPISPRKRRNSKNRNSTATGSRSSSGAFEIKEDGDSAGRDSENNSLHQQATSEMQEVDLNTVALRNRIGFTKHNKTQTLDKISQRRVVSNDSAVSYPTPSPTDSEFAHHQDGLQNIETGDAEIGLDTVMESEGFTMIDLDSLPSVRQMRNTPEYPTIAEEPEETTEAIMEAPSIQLSNITEDSAALTEDLTSSPPSNGAGTKKKTYSIGHLQLPSSTNVHRHRHVTPAPYAMPELPSPPRAPASVTKERSPASSDKAVEAGMALQDAVTPEKAGSMSLAETAQGKAKNENSLFEAFSSSTQRELRAELRFGEELGRKKSSNLQDQYTQPKQGIAQTQVWRGETVVQRTPTIVTAMHNHDPSGIHETQASHAGRELTKVSADSNQIPNWRTRMQADREQVIDEAKSANDDKVLAIESDSDLDEGADEDNDETMGDIWLAEARNHSSSPDTNTMPRDKEPSNGKARRTLIPSPWKRGEQLDPDPASHLTANESFSGLFIKQNAETPKGGFGAAIVANPNKAHHNKMGYDRRRSGEFDPDSCTFRQSRRLSPRREFEDEIDSDREHRSTSNGVQWRDASDIIEDETSKLEEGQKMSDCLDNHGDVHAGATTRLYETNLEDLSDQDLSSSPHIPLGKKRQIRISEHDSTYSSLSEESTEEMYRQRTSLSPSKERPNTPRSAMKGGRASFGMALKFGTDSEEANDKKVVWARRMSCMNEDWEESSRSIRSTQESFEDDTPTPLTAEKPQSQERETAQHQRSELLEGQPLEQETKDKGWFGWFKHTKASETSEALPKTLAQDETIAREISPGLDGSMEKSIQEIDDENKENYAPTSRHIPVAQEATEQKVHGKQNERERSRESKENKVPSYLRPPSYPSDPHRDATTLLTTSGEFTKSHFKTLHIIYRKSLGARFHGPSYPTEVRPELVNLVDKEWSLTVDETETMDDAFRFRVGVLEAQVLERFMREVEHGYEDNGIHVTRWEWSAENLADKLGRIAIGEIVREEEREAKKIMGRKEYS